MNKAVLFSVFGGILMLSSSAVAMPHFVSYSGRLSDGLLWGQSASITVTAAIYDCECDSSTICTHPCQAGEDEPIYRGEFPNVSVVDGYFTLQLGMCDEAGFCSPDPALAKFPSELPALAWLEISLNSGASALPRVPIGSVPYALHANVANEAVFARHVADSTKEDLLLIVDDDGCPAQDRLGSAASPFCTIQDALNSLPKQINHVVVIEVNPGNYYDTDESGNPSPVILRGFHGSGELTITGTSVLDKPKFWSSSANAVLIERAFLTVTIDKFQFIRTTQIDKSILATKGSPDVKFEDIDILGTIVGSTVPAIMSGRASHIYADNILITSCDVGFLADQGGRISIRAASSELTPVAAHAAYGGIVSFSSLATMATSSAVYKCRGGLVVRHGEGICCNG